MPNHPDLHSLQQAFGTLSDTRRDHTKHHELLDILLIAVCCLLCGGTGFTHMEQFGHAKFAWLRTFLSLPNGIPSHDTFRRVFSLLDPHQFATAFLTWTQSRRTAVSAEIVALDGKTVRCSFDRAQGRGPIHLVSAWASVNRLVLGQLKTAEKSNEITAVPELLRALELAGCVVTVDALNCQKTIAQEIHEADADYVLALKANQGTAHTEVRDFLQDARQRNFAGVAYDFVETLDKEHGRFETRRYWITEQIDWFADRAEWANLRSFALVEREWEVAGQRRVEQRVFLCSLRADAGLLAQAVRGHWGIENQLHWVIGTPVVLSWQAARRVPRPLAAAACRRCQSLYHRIAVNRSRTAARRISTEHQRNDHIHHFARGGCARAPSTNTPDRDAPNVSTIMPSPRRSQPRVARGQRVPNPRKECTP